MSDEPAFPTPDVVTIYGADWCGDCRRAKRFLDAEGIPYRYLDLEADAGAQRLVDDAGIRSIPIVVTPAGQVLIDPSIDDLASAVGRSG
jgi:glutaredoxin